MAGNRKRAEALCIELINELVPDGSNEALYREAFKAMDDDQFDQWIQGLESGKIRLAIVVPSFSESGKKFNNRHLLNVAKKWGHDFFERIWLPTSDGTLSLSNHKYLVIELPVRRQAQILEDKISLPTDNNTIDQQSGQPSGDSKGSRLSSVEIGIIDNLDLPEPLLELIKYRGGDVQGFRLIVDQIHQTGSASLEATSVIPTEVVAKRTLSTLLTSQHLGNNL